MPSILEIPFKPTNQIWRTYRHFPYKAWYAVGELVDNSTQSFFDNREALTAAYTREGEGLRVSIQLDPHRRTLVVADNAMGMELDELKHAVQLAHPPSNTRGRSEFGMGMKTACSWLGGKWSVKTKRLGSRAEYSFEIDIGRHAASESETLAVTKKDVNDAATHYTIITVDDVRGEIQRRAVGRIKQHLAEMYRRDIQQRILTLLWNGERLEPPDISILETSFEVRQPTGEVVSQTRRWKRDVDFTVTIDPLLGNVQRVTGWIGLVSPGGRNKAGFDLLRRGRVVIGRPTGYRPERIFGTDRNDLINQRVYGELNLDEFPVNHLKDDFLWDQWGEEFEEKLTQASSDYVDMARSYRPTRQGITSVPPVVVQATNDAIAEALSTEELASRIHLLESVGPTPPPPPEVQAAEAEILRNQAIEPRIIELQGKTYRIYHPVGMAREQAYVRYEAPQAHTVDIFINDNHPTVEGIDESELGAERYRSHARTCVQDAIVTHLISGLGRDVSPSLFLQFKDQVLRAWDTLGGRSG